MKDFPPHSENKPSGENIPNFDLVYVNKTQTTNTTKYIIDSGCTRHVISTKENFSHFTPGNFGENDNRGRQEIVSQGPGG